MIAKVNGVIDDRTLVAIDPGFIEAADPQWLGLPPDDERYAFLLAPLAYYPLRGRIRLLPYRLDDRTRPYFESEILSSFSTEDRFVVISRGRGPFFWSSWLDGRLGRVGYSTQKIYESSALGAAGYERRRDAIHAPAASPSTNVTMK
jgi:hypothetical protein